MIQTARKLSPLDASEHAARVARIEGAVLVLRGSAGEVRARRAASCMLQPTLGDLVLAAVLGDGSAYVLAVLERGDADVPSELLVEGDVALRVSNGRLEVFADQGVELRSPEHVKVASRNVEIVSKNTHLLFDELKAMGRDAVLEATNGRILGTVLETVADMVHLTAKRAIRVVTEIDQTRAKRVDHLIEKSLTISAENASVMATSLVRMDGSNIQLG